MTNIVKVQDNRNKVVLDSSAIRVIAVGSQGPAGSNALGGKAVETNPSLSGGEFLVYDATDDRFEFVNALDAGEI
jgi:ketol-acid reductoisomerase